MMRMTQFTVLVGALALLVGVAVADERPTVAFSEPAAGAIVSGDVLLRVEFSSNSAYPVERLDIFVDGVRTAGGGRLPNTRMSGTEAFYWDSRVVSNGPHDLAARAGDGAGNQATTTIMVRVANQAEADTTPPTVAITSPDPEAVIRGTVEFAVDARDNGGVSWVNFYVDGQLWAARNFPPFVESFDTTQLSDGQHTLRAGAYDDDDNFASSPSITVFVNNSGVAPETPSGGPPLIIEIIPETGTPAEGSPGETAVTPPPPSPGDTGTSDTAPGKSDVIPEVMGAGPVPPSEGGIPPSGTSSGGPTPLPAEVRTLLVAVGPFHRLESEQGPAAVVQLPGASVSPGPPTETQPETVARGPEVAPATTLTAVSPLEATVAQGVGIPALVEAPRPSPKPIEAPRESTEETSEGAAAAAPSSPEAEGPVAASPVGEPDATAATPSEELPEAASQPEPEPSEEPVAATPASGGPPEALLTVATTHAPAGPSGMTPPLSTFLRPVFPAQRGVLAVPGPLPMLTVPQGADTRPRAALASRALSGSPSEPAARGEAIARTLPDALGVKD